MDVINQLSHALKRSPSKSVHSGIQMCILGIRSLRSLLDVAEPQLMPDG